MYMKGFWALMMTGALCTALATMHRMPLISLSIGIVYLVFLFSHRMRLHTVMLILMLGAGFVVTTETLMTQYTPTGSVFNRIEGTKFYGAIPDSRRGAWSQAWERGMERPWLGHGPHYDIRYTVSKVLAPHNSYLYYFYTIGVIGVAIYLWFLFTLVRMTTKYLGARMESRGFAWDLLVVQHVQLVVFLIDTIKINFQRSPIYTLLVWLMIGSIATTYRIVSSQAAQMRVQQRALSSKEVGELESPGL